MRLRASAVLVLAASTALSGCYWLRYHDLVETHTELMERLAVDAGDALTSASVGLRPSDIERLQYPLDRARQFSEISRRRFADRASLARFDELVGAYAKLVGHVDLTRTRDLDATVIARTRGMVRDVARGAAAVRSAVAAER